jgi:hypothetical protein
LKVPRDLETSCWRSAPESATHSDRSPRCHSPRLQKVFARATRPRISVFRSFQTARVRSQMRIHGRRPRARRAFPPLYRGWWSTMRTDTRCSFADARQDALAGQSCALINQRAAAAPPGGKVIPVHGQEHARHLL